ncbi:MAG: hypothetical protein F6K09_02215 [Merismopedia sp. SIO2A8]|nr:hypothetical protein [Merismopedia sp. SIO2A8]
MINDLKLGVAGVAIALPAALPVALSIVTLASHPSQALPRAYDFSVNVTQGALEGMTFGGIFCYDDAVIQSEGLETIGVSDGLNVEMTFFNQAFTASDDIDYPDFPTLILEDGTVQRLDFWVEPGTRDNWWDLPGWDVTVMPSEKHCHCEEHCP